MRLRFQPHVPLHNLLKVLRTSRTALQRSGFKVLDGCGSSEFTGATAGVCQLFEIFLHVRYSMVARFFGYVGHPQRTEPSKKQHRPHAVLSRSANANACKPTTPRYTKNSFARAPDPTPRCISWLHLQLLLAAGHSSVCTPRVCSVVLQSWNHLLHRTEGGPASLHTETQAQVLSMCGSGALNISAPAVVREPCSI